MAKKYFIAGVGRVVLYDSGKLYASANTLVDSSLTIGVTAEDIH